MKRILLLCLLLAGCDRPNTAEPDAGNKLDRGDVALIAIAPDGTHLWKVMDDGEGIYFSSSGTSHTVPCGRGCWRDDHVSSN